jgi:MFS family permease
LLLLLFVAWEGRCAQPMIPLRLFRSRAFAVGNATAFLMSGAIFAGAYFITQEFQFARGYSPVLTGLRLLPFFATPMVISPLAGAIAGKVGLRPVLVLGLSLQAVGFAWVCLRGGLGTSWVELTCALLIAGIGISMALPTVPTAVLGAVELDEMGKASGISNMMQRLGAVFGVAIGTSVFAAYGHLGTPASVTDGFKPAFVVCTVFAALAALTAVGMTARKRFSVPSVPELESVDSDVERYAPKGAA